MARKYNYQPRTRVSTNRVGERRKVRTEQKVIKEVQPVEENGVQKLKITTMNGTRCTISQQDEEYRYDYERWEVLSKCLKAGDKVEMDIYAGKIINCRVELSRNYYKVVKFQKSNHDDEEEVILTLKNEEEEIEVKITEFDIEEKIHCEDYLGDLFWDTIYLTQVICCEVVIYTLSKRVVFLKFDGCL